MKWMFLALLLSSSVFAGIYDIKETAIDGKEYPLSQLKGKTVLIVNLASQCGYTEQLGDLEKLYQKYKEKNFVVLGVPTNDFMGQTPENDPGFLEFCQKNYSATFPIMKKGTVKGEKKRELYKFLTEQSPRAFKGEINWNFNKFLINKEGEVVNRWGSSMKPFASDVTESIEKNL